MVNKSKRRIVLLLSAFLTTPAIADKIFMYSLYLVTLLIIFVPQAKADSMFGTKMLPGPVSAVFRAHQNVIRLAYSLDNLAEDCRIFGNRYCKWMQLLELAKGKSESKQLALVHGALKRNIKYLSDQEAHQQAEYFQSARETMDTESGDCEDYAILGMWILERLGFASENLFVVLVGDRPEKIDHAVLAIKFEANFKIVDNKAPEIYSANNDLGIKPAISFNRNGVWMHARPTSAGP